MDWLKWEGQMGKEVAKGTKGGNREKKARSSIDPATARAGGDEMNGLEATHTNGGKGLSRREKVSHTRREKFLQILLFCSMITANLVTNILIICNY